MQSFSNFVESQILEETVDDSAYSEEICSQNENIITVDFADYSAAMLQTKKPKDLKCKILRIRNLLCSMVNNTTQHFSAFENLLKPE